MIAASLIVAALIGAPFAPRSVVPVPSADVAVAVAPMVFDPRSSARAHQATIRVTPAADGVLAVVVESGTGSIVETLAAADPASAGRTRTWTWDGGGAADGTYGIHVTLAKAAGGVADAVVPVTIDSRAPRVALARLRPSGTARGPIRLRAGVRDLSGASSATLEVLSQVGVPVGSVRIPVERGKTSIDATWNLRLGGRLLLPGVFRVRLRVADRAGNVGVSKGRLLRIRRPVQAEVIYSLREAGPVVALTFDDCFSGRAMRRIVRSFHRAGAHTTFFCNGTNILGNADAMRAAIAAGDTIGSHTWSHPQMPRLPYAEQVSQIQGDVDRWWQIGRVSPSPFFRPPYGLFNAATVRAAGAAGFRWVVLWDVDPSDYLHPSPAELVRHVATHARAGSIVVMHVEPNTAAAVPDLIAAVRAKGLEPVSLDEMLGRASYLSATSG